MTPAHIGSHPADATIHERTYEFVRSRYDEVAERGFTVNRNQLLAQTVQFVQDQSDASDMTAQTIASHAIGEYEGRRATVAFDLDRCTPHTVFLRDASSDRMYVVTALELSRLLARHNGQLHPERK